MPELLRLHSAHFELTVWVSDITSRRDAYQRTLAKRASWLNVEHAARLSPPLAPVQWWVEGQEGEPSPEPTDTLPLSHPLFFEQTQYQFEWTFLGDVSHAELVHRSALVNEAFRFVPESDSPRGRVLARLTGTIHTGNDVGWLRIPLRYVHQGKAYTQSFSFQVLPTKMVLDDDLPAMYRTIDEVYPLWRFSLVEKTEQDAGKSVERGDFPLLWLANFSSLRTRFEQGLSLICAAPHSRLQASTTARKADRLKGRLGRKLSEQVKQDLASGQWDKRYRVEKQTLSVDTPENRFIKMAVSHCARQLAKFEARLRESNQAPERQRLSDAFLEELHRWQQPLTQRLSQSFLKEVRPYSGSNRESLVLQQKTGYSAVYRIWQELKCYLDLFGEQASVSMKSVAEIYEVWCFLAIKQILENTLGFELVESKAATLRQNAHFEMTFRDGFRGAFLFQRRDGVKARLVHEPIFGQHTAPIRTYLLTQKPDILLEVTFPSDHEAEEAKRALWVFDAKYRIKTESSRYHTKASHASQGTETPDFVPDDAINQMHRYRDALIQLDTHQRGQAVEGAQKSRPVFGAFALYPGFFEQEIQPNPYSDSIAQVGIGAFALLPSQSSASGQSWLQDFLSEQIGLAPQAPSDAYPTLTHEDDASSQTDHWYIQEAARIPYYGMRQVRYPDLTLTAPLGGQRGRQSAYFDAFIQGRAKWYHLPQRTFQAKFKHHVAQEIRYLALATTDEHQSQYKQIETLWPVRGVSLVARRTLSAEQAGREVESDEPYYLFELGRPLTLQRAIKRVPHRPVKHAMKLTTLEALDNTSEFKELQSVYGQAL